MKLYIDIGASNAEEAAQVVQPGDIAYFDSVFVPFGERRIKAKALDDRAGCAVLLEMIESDLPYDLDFAFTVQEEVGLRGAGAAAYQLNPDYAIVVETTTAADIAGVQPHKRVCALGGRALRFPLWIGARSMTGSSMILPFPSRSGKISAAKAKRWVAGNDAGAIDKSRGGVKTITVSVPCRDTAFPFLRDRRRGFIRHYSCALAQSFANDSLD